MTREQLIEEVAKALCETRTWPGAWIRANEVEMAACRNDACVALATVARSLEVVTPEMVEAWETASTDWNDQMPTEQFETACCQANWSAMLAVSALHPAPTDKSEGM